eukprot:7653625-Pyramimonas_sp.AAC.1
MVADALEFAVRLGAMSSEVVDTITDVEPSSIRGPAPSQAAESSPAPPLMPPPPPSVGPRDRDAPRATNQTQSGPSGAES